jgi:hypothetical protein
VSGGRRHGTLQATVVKTFRDSRGCIIVPARAADSDAIDRLAGVLDALRPLGQPIVLVAQLDAASRTAFAALAASHGPAVHGVTLDRPVGKWPAVGHALPLLSGVEDWVAVFDGDGAFSASDLPALVEPITAGRAVHAIGRRPERSLSLEAVGQASARSRVHLEAFFNTVTLLTLGVTGDDPLCGFDIQCGLHVFAGARCARMARGALPFYGGELLLFFETVEAGGTVVAADVTVGVNPPSAYRMSEIVDGLLGLHFITTAGRRHFDRALTIAPQWYKGWGLDQRKFENEIDAIVLERAAGR